MTPSQEEYRTIPLTRGQVAIVDAADYEWLNQWKWHARWTQHTRSYYAGRGITTFSGPKRSVKIVLMHRAILGFVQGDGKIADHINHDTLDNRKANLRIATPGENVRNQRRSNSNIVGFRGVSRNGGKWMARISLNRRVIHLGTYSTPELAAVAYREAALKYHGEFACI